MLTVVKVNNKNTRTMSRCSIFNFEHIQQLNLIFLIFNFEDVFVSWAQDKIHKTI